MLLEGVSDAGVDLEGEREGIGHDSSGVHRCGCFSALDGKRTKVYVQMQTTSSNEMRSVGEFPVVSRREGGAVENPMPMLMLRLALVLSRDGRKVFGEWSEVEEIIDCVGIGRERWNVIEGWSWGTRVGKDIDMAGACSPRLIVPVAAKTGGRSAGNTFDRFTCVRTPRRDNTSGSDEGEFSGGTPKLVGGEHSGEKARKKEIERVKPRGTDRYAPLDAGQPGSSRLVPNSGDPLSFYSPLTSMGSSEVSMLSAGIRRGKIKILIPATRDWVFLRGKMLIGSNNEMWIAGRDVRSSSPRECCGELAGSAGAIVAFSMGKKGLRRVRPAELLAVPTWISGTSAGLRNAMILESSPCLDCGTAAAPKAVHPEARSVNLSVSYFSDHCTMVLLTRGGSKVCYLQGDITEEQGRVARSAPVSGGSASSSTASSASSPWDSCGHSTLDSSSLELPEALKKARDFPSLWGNVADGFSRNKGMILLLSRCLLSHALREWKSRRAVVWFFARQSVPGRQATKAALPPPPGRDSKPSFLRLWSRNKRQGLTSDNTGRLGVWWRSTHRPRHSELVLLEVNREKGRQRSVHAW